MKRNHFFALCIHRSTLLGSLLLLFAPLALWAQVTYNFQTPNDVAAATGAGHSILTMDCLAANGYGQWTASSSTTNVNSAKSLFLLSNRLTTLTATDAQAGVLAAKTPTFTGGSGDAYPTEAIKCAANLKGNVRYVWLNSTSSRDKLYVNGFDPATTDNASTGIGIDFVSLPATNSEKIVKDNNAVLFVDDIIASGHTLVSSSNESLYPDMFDVAIDASYLYVVWEEYASSTYTIHAAAVNLSTSAVTLLGTGGTGFVANGRCPTIAIDVRHSGSIGNVDIVFLNTIPGQPQWTEWNGTLFPTPMLVPFLLSNQTWPASSATHARIVDASAAGSGSTDKAIYFIAADNTGKKCLCFNRITSGSLAVNSYYCDGASNTTRPSPCPIETSAGFPLVDDYIRAFADPYQGNTTAGSFDEFHCLYVLNHSGGTINVGAKGGTNPLMIIANNDPSKGYFVSGGTSTGDFPYFDPVATGSHQPCLYVGAANQMGIHPHWLADSSGVRLHYYRRDLRYFDQNIEENTLVTDLCKVADGSGHGGSLTPTLLQGLTMTLYSDPSGQVDYAGSAQLTILAGTSPNVVTLKIGDGSTNTSGSFKIVGCRSQIVLNDNSLSKFEVHSDDSVVCYSNYLKGTDGNFATFNGGTLEFTGTNEATLMNMAGYAYVNTIANPVTLITHGNTLLKFDDYALTMTDVNVAYRYDNSVTGSGNHTGIIWSYTDATFNKCRFISADNTANNPIYNCRGGYSGQAASTTFDNCYFSVGSHTYIEALANDVHPSNPGGLTVSGGYFDGVTINTALAPYDQQPVSIDGAEFENIWGVGISYEQDPTTTVEYSFNASNSYFGNFKDLSNYPNPEGIKVMDCTNADWRTDINVESNLFVQGSGGEADGSIAAAIHFEDAIGDIGYNSIGSSTSTSLYAKKFQTGIWNESSSGSTNTNSTTLICGNDIFGLTHSGAAGISTDWYIGYAKLNTIKYCANGQISGTHDVGHIIASTISNNSGPGYTSSGNSVMDFAGVHHPSPYEYLDVAAYNLIKDNNSGGTQLSLTGSSGTIIYLGLAPAPKSWPTSEYGRNNIQGSPEICASSSTALNDISNNYWGGGAYSLCSGTTATGGYLTSDPGSSGFVCSGGLIIKPKGDVPLFSPAVSDSSCGYLFSQGYLLESAGDGKQAYDTLRLLIEECPAWLDSATHIGEAFSFVNGAISEWSKGGIGRWPDYLEFLKKVLYNDLDTMWYCSDVEDMFSAAQQDVSMQLSIARYILDNNKCLAFRDDFIRFYNSDSKGKRQAWLDSLTLIYQIGQQGNRYQDWDTTVQKAYTQDTTLHPYDSTYGTIDDHGLGILRGPQHGNVLSGGTISAEALLAVRVEENPFENELDVSYDMGRTAMVSIELHDLLGKSIPIQNAKYLLSQPGTHEAKIPLEHLPPGTYYLRLLTDTGDVRTVKVIKK